MDETRTARPKEPKSFRYVVDGVYYKVYKHPYGYWYVDFTVDGKRVRKTLKAKTKPEAEDAIQALFRKAPAETKLRRLTLQESSEMFMRHRREVKKRKPKTIAKYKSTMDS